MNENSFWKETNIFLSFKSTLLKTFSKSIYREIIHTWSTALIYYYMSIACLLQASVLMTSTKLSYLLFTQKLIPQREYHCTLQFSVKPKKTLNKTIDLSLLLCEKVEWLTGSFRCLNFFIVRTWISHQLVQSYLGNLLQKLLLA